MSDWNEAKRITSADETRYVQILTDKDRGLFCFVEHAKFTEEEPHQTYDYFAPTHQSGLYQSASDAEQAARLELPWLRADSSK
ncbi:MAG TPA: hypothetical protein VID67_07630 [Rhizomicrobium sp.]